MMHKTGQDLLSLMFRPNEEICASPDKYGYHSIPLSNVLGDQITLLNTKFRDGGDPSECTKTISTDKLLLVALNPIKGWREDASCTAFRNFLIEMDYGPLTEQMAYAKKIELPYSAAVFSGNKSIHFLISLSDDLPNETVWRTMAEWTLAIASAADQNTKNPSRQIRIPGAYREPEKQQKLIEIKPAITQSEFAAWLAKYPDAKPKPPEKRERSIVWDPTKIKKWAQMALAEGKIGSKHGRNKEWYALSYEFCLAGYGIDDTIDILSQFFTPDQDFKDREWKTCIKSAYKNAYARK